MRAGHCVQAGPHGLFQALGGRCAGASLVRLPVGLAFWSLRLPVGLAPAHVHGAHGVQDGDDRHTYVGEHGHPHVGDAERR